MNREKTNFGLVGTAREQAGGLSAERAVCYYRRSSDLQELSIEQQEAEVRAYVAKRGFEVVGEYYDRGRSGSRDQDKRTDFKRMLIDAEQKLFSVIVCWDTSRFARLDSLEAAAAKLLLRTNGVRLETVREGQSDWNTFAGRLLDMISSEKNHGASRDLSANSVRGREQTLELGYWPHGSVPFGYDRLYLETSGKTHFVGRGEKFSKARAWKLKLVVNEAEAETVRAIFQDLFERGTSLRQIGLDLNARGVPSPGRKSAGWKMSTVRGILTNPVYVGDGHIGMRRHRVKEPFKRASSRSRPDCCPPIVAREVFDAVQQQLLAKRELGLRPQKHRSSALTGVLFCGKCGFRMQKKPPYKGRVYFTCPSAIDRPNLECGHWRVYEDDMMSVVTKLLFDKVEEEELRALHRKPPIESTAHLDVLKDKAAELGKLLQRGRKRYLTAPDELMSGLATTLKDLEAELANVNQQLRLGELARETEGPSRYLQWLGTIREKLVSVRGIEWGHEHSQREPIQVPLDERDRIRSHLGGKPGKCLAYWRDDQLIFGKGDMLELDERGQLWRWSVMVGPVKPAISVEADVLREFLRKLGVKVTVSFKRKFKRNWELDRANIQAEISSHVMSTRTATRAPATSTGILEQAPTSRARSWSR